MSAGRRRSVLGDGRDVAGAFCALALAVLAGLAGGASPWHGSADAPGAPAGVLHVVLPVGGVALVTALLLLWMATPATPATRRKRRRAAPTDVEGAGTAAWTGAKAGAAAMLAVAAICLAAWPLLTADSSPTPAGGRPSADAAGGPPRQRNAEGGGTVDLAWLVLPAALALALLAPAAVVVRRRRMPRAVAVRKDSPVLARGVRASIERLEAEHDPRRAIVLAYECMEEAFREVEIVRARDETSSEFLLRATRRLPVGADAAATLTERFEEARFSGHEVAETHRRLALASLRRVARALEGSQ
jgi:Domain of unknown function (DUF4129)